MAPHALLDGDITHGEPELKKRRTTLTDASGDFGHFPQSDEKATGLESADSNHLRSHEPLADRDSHDEAEDGRVPPHPLGVKPLGNLFTGSAPNIKKNAGLFDRLPDELLQDLLQYLQASDLLRLGATCRALYAFCCHDENWRTLFVESAPESFRWLGTWRNTYCKRYMNARVNCEDLYSDTVYRPYFCAKAALDPYVRDIPERNKIARLSDLTYQQFMEEGWADRPFILTEPVKQWPVFKNWSKQRLLDLYATTPFRAEAVDWPLERYVEYMDASTDESPLYLFDCRFTEKMKLCAGDRPVPEGMAADYTPPSAFGSDLFNVLGNARPNDRWLIVGPGRSGSTFHKDPNGTSAWNAVITGEKYWLMFPSTVRRRDAATGMVRVETLPTPPGVFLSADGSEVTSPLSIAEYMLSFHAAARKTAHCIEGICREGEILHVPSGWFHLVLNLKESIALTQNFVPQAKLKDVLLFLRDTPEQISGFSPDVKPEDVFSMFMNRLKLEQPEVAVQAEQELALHDVDAEKPEAKSKWEELTSDNAGGFSFGFAGDDEEDVDIP